MKIKKSVLVEVLKVLGKVVSQTSPEIVQRSVRFLGSGSSVAAMATDGVELVALKLEVEAEGVTDFAVEYKALRELIRSTRDSEVEVSGERIDWPMVEVVPVDAKTIALPGNFAALLAEAAPIVDRNEVRRPLQGIRLCREGIVVTDGKQLLLLSQNWQLPEAVTLPFPLALLTAEPEESGTLTVWKSQETHSFKIEIGGFVWFGKAIAGSYPNWRQVLPEKSAHNYSITFTPEQAAQLVEFLKCVPDSPPFHAIELNAVPDGVAAIPANFPDMELRLAAEISGVRPREVLALNKHILLRMLQQGYTKFNANSDGGVPVIAEGGSGQYLAMPIRIHPKPITQPVKEEKKMEEPKRIESSETALSPLDELNGNVEELRNKLKSLFDESAVLLRKVKEVALAQKQKERDFIQAKRAIERIKMAI